MTQCTARSKRTGERCKGNAVEGRTVCYQHGGATPVGPALPQYKDGRHSKYLPGRLAESYRAAVNDAELLALRDDIALIDARLVELIGKIDTGESGEAWRTARDEHRALTTNLQLGLVPEANRNLEQLGRIIRQGMGDYMAWREIGEMLDRRERLVRSERQKMVQLQQMITSGQALVLMTRIVQLVKDNVSDPDALTAISDGIRRLATVDS